jgi:2-haloacid dehalogenase
MAAHPYQLITFDVYTALFDVEASLTPVVDQILQARGDSLDLVRTWRQKQLEYALISNSLGRDRIPFRVITRRALDYALRRARLDPAEPDREQLVASWDALQLWPEAGQVLMTIKARGYRIGLLSNGDEAMLHELARRLPVRCDHIFAAEQAGYYKPHPGVYALPCQILGLRPDEILHVAGSAADVMGAKAAGLHCAWSNRRHDLVLDAKHGPDYEFETLRGMLDLI